MHKHINALDFIPFLTFTLFSLSSLVRRPLDKRSEAIFNNNQQKGELCLG